jgi:hypothetical protein
MLSNINLCLLSANIYEAFSIKYERKSNYYNEEDLKTDSIMNQLE